MALVRGPWGPRVLTHPREASRSSQCHTSCLSAPKRHRHAVPIYDFPCANGSSAFSGSTAATALRLSCSLTQLWPPHRMPTSGRFGDAGL